jgi:N-(2-amino-2-carboxyethyl)-L-glutamate synthase
METNSGVMVFDRAVERIGNTPMRRLRMSIGGRNVTVCLKLEGYNPAGSSKDRTAAALIGDLEQHGRLNSSSVIVESTSGNLGVALAYLCHKLGYAFVAVIDPKTTAENRARMLAHGARLELVETQDANGGYLMSRLNKVRELCALSTRYVWTNQYSNHANPRAHYESTAPEIYRQMGGRVDAIFVPVSTGGTLVGIARYLREVSPSTRIIAVDAVGSVVFGGPSEPRKLTGIGSSRRSDFIQPDHYDEHILVSDLNAFAMCRRIAELSDISVGGSSGAVVYACSQYLAQHSEVEIAACLCADRGENYASSIFDDEWLCQNGFDCSQAASSLDMITIAGEAGGAVEET